ncbi:hypothetical protein D9M72_633570 [compost metagenome]
MQGRDAGSVAGQVFVTCGQEIPGKSRHQMHAPLTPGVIIQFQPGSLRCEAPGGRDVIGHGRAQPEHLLGVAVAESLQARGQ